jgi:flagellar basal-body rod modification protein FlgD
MTVTMGPVGTVTSTTATTGTTASSSSSTSASNQMDQDTFLKLLVAQMKYQDPSSPTDPTQFISQTAQFTEVDKLTQMATLNQQIYDSTRQQTAVAMIGQSVSYTDASGTSRTGTVTGVSVGASTPNVTIGGVAISLDSVTAVGTTASTTTDPSTA